MEAISLNKPIVTLPGPYAKSKLAYSVLKALNIEEIILNSKKEYVQMSIKLAKEKNFRESIVNKISKNKIKLFNDNRSIKYLEKILKGKIINS